jgi:hypothetical protein
MKLIPALLTLCALVLPRALPAETFEGKVSMNLTSSSSKGGSQAMTMSIKDGFLRTDVSTSRGAAAMIMDFKNQQMLILMAQQRMYMVQPIPQPGSTGQPGMPQAPAAPASAPKETLVDSGAKETILGYVCTKYTVTGAKGTSEVWATDQLGTFAGIFRGGPPGGRPQAPEAWESALKGKGFFPMRVVTTTNGSESFRLEVTSVEKTSLPDSLFAPPAGWQKLDLASMMGGAMQRGFPGARPSDGNN